MPRKRLVRRVLLALLALVVVVVLVVSIGATTMIRRSLPDRDGTAALPGLDAQVTVLRDDRGIPQVYASTATDLFMAQGYVHAQDRFFEMDLRRHITAGRLSELVGLDLSEYAARYMDEDDIRKAELDEARAARHLTLRW